MKRWLLAGVALVGCSQAEAEPKAVGGKSVLPLPAIEFLGIEWAEPQAYRGALARAWSYSNAKFPNVRVIETRAFDSDELLNRWTQARRDASSNWMEHGVEVAYYQNGSLGVSQNCNGKPICDFRSGLPMQDWDPQSCESCQ